MWIKKETGVEDVVCFQFTYLDQKYNCFYVRNYGLYYLLYSDNNSAT